MNEITIGKSKLINGDCMAFMKDIPDNYYELAIVDPPYGIGIDGQKATVNIVRNPKQNRKEHINKGWDSSAPNKDYFIELQRVSKNQIIWGANYFIEHLSKPTKAWIFWYKGQNDLTMSDGEIAYTSFDKPTRQININRGQLAIDGTIHPTQKPIKLYEWLLTNYAKQGDKILDTHGGSFSSAIAANNLGYEFTGIELDKDYYDAAVKRVTSANQQIRMFA